MACRTTFSHPGRNRSLLSVFACGLTVLVAYANSSVASDANRQVSFRREVLPLLTKLGCNSGPCHGNLTGKGGLKLSLRGENPATDWFTLTHEASGRRLSRNRPEASLLLAKPSGEIPHEGGVKFKPGDVAFGTLRSWITQGATDDMEAGPQLSALTVTPGELWTDPGKPREVDLRVQAHWSDGSKNDVTDLAGFDIADPTGAAITTSGRFTADRPGEWVVGVRYLGGHAASRLVFLEDNPGFAWSDPKARTSLDRTVFDKLRKLRRNPSPEAAPETLLRRVYLDLLGVLPTAGEIREFLADVRPDRYERRVDQLLERPEFAEFWALKWSDLLRNEPKVMGPKGNRQFYRWLRDRIAADEPMDRFARELITTTGSTWADPASAFHRTNRDPETAAETFAQVFLGYRFQCAKCHNHVSDVWTQDDYYGLAANFANLRRKDINNVRRDRFDKHEVNGDVVIFFQGKPEITQPRSGVRLPAKPPGGEKLAGSATSPDAALEHLADWLTRDNRQFARNLANRVWFQLMGRGVVDPVDDFRDTNPPSNPALLDALEKSFVQAGYRIKPLAREIVTSTVYRVDSLPAANSPATESDFGRAIVKLLPAEVLRDIVDQSTGYARPSDDGPNGQRAAQEAAAVTRGEEFMRVFGKPERLLSCECERSDDTTLAQAFQLINGVTVRRALESRENRIETWLRQCESDMPGAVEDLFLSTLSRRPTSEETSATTAYLKNAANLRRAWEDLVWATLNAKEFLFRH
ncbi:DUF1549 domain-containing protein [bacterium]|nr:DUF1549 domain-containing protein [bacterium]